MPREFAARLSFPAASQLKIPGLTTYVLTELLVRHANP
jgi:hypothetical protein